MSNQFHVGRGTTRGALTVFPIWAEVVHPVSYSMDHSLARVGERPDGANVNSLAVLNTAGVPLLLLEGQLLEGGLQHRMVARSVLLAPGEQLPLDVMCVEHGRWHGAGGHQARGRRVSNSVRSGLRSDDAQGEVWRRVRRYEAERGSTATESYVDHADRGEAKVRRLVRGLRPFPGQVGVLVGLSGQPLAAEVFDTPRMLARQFGQIIRAAALDAIGLAPVETPGRRARRFLYRADLVTKHAVGPAGIAEDVRGRTEYVDLSALLWDGRELYTQLTNPRHELVLAA